MAEDQEPELTLPQAEAAFARLATAVAEPASAEVEAVPGLRARELAAALLAGIAAGTDWDDAWFSGPGPAVADDHLVAALLEAAAALLHLGADAAGLAPEEFLRRALEAPPAG